MSHYTVSRKGRSKGKGKGGGKKSPVSQKGSGGGPGKAQQQKVSPVVAHLEDQLDGQAEETTAIPVSGVAFGEPDAAGTVVAEVGSSTADLEATESESTHAEVGAVVSPRRLRQAAKLGLDASDPRFTLAVSSGPMFHYVESLGATAWKLALLTEKDIRGLVPITPEQWVERRRRRLDLLTDEDKAAQAAVWALPLNHSNVVWAMEAQGNWDFARTLTSDQLNFISNNNKKRKKVPTEAEIENVRTTRVKEQAELDKKIAAEKAAAAKKLLLEEHAQKKVDWAAYSSELLSKMKARLDAEAPGLAPETVAALLKDAQDRVARTSKTVADSPTVSLPKQIKSLESDLAATIKKENKRAAVAKAKAEFSTVRTATLTALASTVVDDAKLTVEDFRASAEEERIKQRNLHGVTDPEQQWAKLLQLTLYGSGTGGLPFERLTDRRGLKVHYSIDTSGINAATAFTKDTTAVELLDGLFTVSHRPSRLHVTLETGARDAHGGFALPHRYWAHGTDNAYDMTCDAGMNVRFRAPHTWASTKSDLDAAFTEIYDRLLARAEVLLAKDCNI